MNEAAYAYDNGGLVQTSWQDHDDEASTSGSPQSPHIDYSHVDGNPGGAVASLRLASVTYPSGPASRNVLYYQYPSSGIGAALGRVEELTSDSAGDDEYAAYTYLGASTIVKITHPEVSGGLELDHRHAQTRPM